VPYELTIATSYFSIKEFKSEALQLKPPPIPKNKEIKIKSHIPTLARRPISKKTHTRIPNTTTQQPITNKLSL
jgi:hypothetical protein